MCLAANGGSGKPPGSTNRTTILGGGLGSGDELNGNFGNSGGGRGFGPGFRPSAARSSTLLTPSPSPGFDELDIGAGPLTGSKPEAPGFPPPDFGELDIGGPPSAVPAFAPPLDATGFTSPKLPKPKPISNSALPPSALGTDLSPPLLGSSSSPKTSPAELSGSLPGLRKPVVRAGTRVAAPQPVVQAVSQVAPARPGPAVPPLPVRPFSGPADGVSGELGDQADETVPEFTFDRTEQAAEIARNPDLAFAAGGKDILNRLEGHILGGSTRRDRFKLEALIDRVFARDDELRKAAKSILRKTPLTEVDKSQAKMALRALRERVSDPFVAAANRETQAFHRAFSREDLVEINTKRGEIREPRDAAVVKLVGVVNKRAELDRLIEAFGPQAEKGNAAAIRNIEKYQKEKARLAKFLPGAFNEVLAENGKLAALPSLPHPDRDQRGAGIQDDRETRARRIRETVTDAGLTALTAAGPGLPVKIAERVIGGIARSRPAKSGVAGVVKGLSVVESYDQGFYDHIRKAMAESGVDFSDRAQVKRFAEENPNLIKKAGIAALVGVLTAEVPGKAVAEFDKLVGGQFGLVGTKVGETAIK